MNPDDPLFATARDAAVALGYQPSRYDHMTLLAAAGLVRTCQQGGRVLLSLADLKALWLKHDLYARWSRPGPKRRGRPKTPNPANLPAFDPATVVEVVS